MSYDAQHGRIIVSDSGANKVHVYSKDGAYLFTIGGELGDKEGQFSYPAGNCVDTRGDAFLFWPL